MKKRVILVGAGGLAREIINFFEHVNILGDLLPINFYIDDTGPSLKKLDYDLQYLGKISDFSPKNEDYFIMAVSDPSLKRIFLEKFSSFKPNFIKLIHSSAIISKTSFIDVGSIIFPYSVVSANSKIGKFVNINTMSSIGHDSCIGDFSTLSAHVDITGGVILGSDVFFGTSSSVLPGIRIGNKVKVGAGATVMRNIKDNQTVYTMPARRL